MRTLTATERQHRGAARHGFDHHEPKRLRPVHREEKRGGLAQEFRFLPLVDLTDELDAGTFDEREDLGAEIVLIDPVHLGGDLERDAGGARYPDGAVRALFRRTRNSNI